MHAVLRILDYLSDPWIALPASMVGIHQASLDFVFLVFLYLYLFLTICLIP